MTNYEQSKHFNLRILIEILILIGFSVFYFITLLTGSVSLYVHPRIKPFLFFAAIVMIIIALLLIRDVKKPGTGKANPWPLLFFIVPLITALSIPAETFSSSTGTASNLQLSTTTSTSTSSVSQESNAEASSDDTVTQEAETDDSSDSEIETQNGVLIFDSDNYYETLCAIYADLDGYVGTEVVLTGFVFRDTTSFDNNQFVPARMLMVCCAADMQTIGLLCQWENAVTLDLDAWVQVTGTIAKITYNGETIPVIEATSVESAERPTIEYVYPY